jgi:lipopolysaccharide transport system ATP-binding protein
LPTSSETAAPAAIPAPKGVPAIRIRGLGKSYTISHETDQASTLVEALSRKIRRPFAKPATETFWALRDVSLDVERGEVVGVVGRNGAGKSTLFKLLSRITEPTEGEVEMYGRVGSLLEVGTGFHPELTGRENIYLNGAILGMKRSEITRHFEAIVDFAEIEQFLDTPVKRYSSGMYVRLAFAVAAHLEPEILIVDEVLAVGDAAFQAKCLGKIKDVARGGGRTVLFVSHNMNAVASLCSRAVVMERGRVAYVGPTAGAIERYAGSTKLSHTIDLAAIPRRSSTMKTVLRKLEWRSAAGHLQSSFGALDEVRLRVTFRSDSPLHDPRIGMGFDDARGERVFAVGSFLGPDSLPAIRGESVVEGTFVMPPLMPGHYTYEIGLMEGGSRTVDAVYSAGNLEVADTNYLKTSTRYFPEMGRLLVPSAWRSV